VYTSNPRVEVLLFRRTKQSGWGRVFWQPITGTIDLDETPDEAARRELEEESGITSWKQFTDLKTPFSFPTRGLGTLHKTLYAVEVSKQPVTIDANEHDAFRWVPLEQIPEMLFWESNMQGFEIFREYLNQ
jgi:dATP pyrophosphohydrolase